MPVHGKAPLVDEQSTKGSITSGIIRGILSNVGGSLVGGSQLRGESVFEERLSTLQETVAVLQEELESKILENERLVMDCSETRRVCRDAESRLEEALSERKSTSVQLEKFRSDIVKLENDKSCLVEKVESCEITVDGLQREIQLQGESSIKMRGVTEGLNQRISEFSCAVTRLEGENRDLKSLLNLSESKLGWTIKRLEEAEAQRRSLEQDLVKERSTGDSLSSRIARLEEDLSVALLHTTSGRPSDNEIDENALPSCNGDLLPKPCCYRAEHYLSLFRTADLAVRSLSSKQREWATNMSELSFLRSQNDQLKQDLNELS